MSGRGKVTTVGVKNLLGLEPLTLGIQGPRLHHSSTRERLVKGNTITYLPKIFVLSFMLVLKSHSLLSFVSLFVVYVGRYIRSVVTCLVHALMHSIYIRMVSDCCLLCQTSLGLA